MYQSFALHCMRVNTKEKDDKKRQKLTEPEIIDPEVKWGQKVIWSRNIPDYNL